MNMGLLMNDLYISVIPSYLCFQLAAAASLHNMVQNNNFVASRLGSSACLISCAATSEPIATGKIADKMERGLAVGNFEVCYNMPCHSAFPQEKVLAAPSPALQELYQPWPVVPLNDDTGEIYSCRQNSCHKKGGG